MFKNVASQKAIFFAFDVTTNLPKTGDAANITPYVSKDFGTVTVFATTTITELDATNAKGFYTGTLSQAETNADTLLFSAKSSTANIVVLGAPATVFTNPANFTTFSIDGSGRIDLGKILGTAASNIQRSTAAIVLGTVGASSSTTSIITSALSPAAAVTDQFKGRIVTFDNGTTTTNLRGQATDITGSSSGGVLTVTALTTAPVSGDTFTIT